MHYKTDAVGTVRANKRCLPANIDKVELQKGEKIIWYRTVNESDYNDDNNDEMYRGKTISVVKWQDKKPVYMLSTFHDDSMTTVKDVGGVKMQQNLNQLLLWITGGA